MDNKIKELNSQYLNMLDDIKFLKFYYHVVIEKNKFLSFELDQVNKNLACKKEEMNPII